jgi:hypothetical protein
MTPEEYLNVLKERVRCLFAIRNKHQFPGIQSVLRDLIHDLIVEAREIENDDDWEFVRLKKKRQALHPQKGHGSRKTTAQTVVSVP